MQTEVLSEFAVATDGLLADSSPMSVSSYTSEEASAGIPFGVCVAQGDADFGAALVAATSDVLIGISVYSNDFEVPFQLVLGDAADPPAAYAKIQPEVTFGVLRKGRVWVRTEEAVSPGDAVRVRGVTSSNDTGYLAANAEQAGAFRTTADDTTDCTDISAFARWLTSADAGDLACLEVDFTNAALSNPD